MPNIDLPTDGEVGTWGGKIRQALTILNTAIEANITSINQINQALSSIGNYVTTATFNSTVSQIMTAIEGCAPGEHQHSLADIGDFANALAPVTNIPILHVSGLDNESQNVTINATLNTLAPLLVFNFDVRFGEEKVEKKDSDGEVVVQKPARSESLWDSSGECTLTVYVTVKNRFTGLVSPQASYSGTCHRFNFVDVDAVVDGLSNKTVFINNVSDASSTKVIARVLAIQGS